MNNIHFNKWFASMVVAIACFATSTLVGCASTDVDAPDESNVNASTGHLLEAGVKAKKLGIFSWRLHDDGKMEAFDADGRMLESFLAYENGRGVENAADSSRKLLLDEKGYLIRDTLLQSDRDVLHALHVDLLAATAAQNSSSALESTQGGESLGKAAQALWIGNACCNAGYAAIVYQWWDAVGPTPYCSFQQQTGSCSGFPDCASVASALGCRYWQ